MSTDIVYLTRYLLGLGPVPPSFRGLDPHIPPDAFLAGRINPAYAQFDVDGAIGTLAAYADLATVDCTGRILHYSQRSGSRCTLSDPDGGHEVFGELVSGLPRAGSR